MKTWTILKFKVRYVLLSFIFLYGCVNGKGCNENYIEDLPEVYFDAYTFIINGESINKESNYYNIPYSTKCPCDINDNNTTSNLKIINKNNGEKIEDLKVTQDGVKTKIGLIFRVVSSDSTAYSTKLKIVYYEYDITEKENDMSYIIILLWLAGVMIMILIAALYVIDAGLKYRDRKEREKINDVTKRNIVEFIIKSEKY